MLYLRLFLSMLWLIFSSAVGLGMSLFRWGNVNNNRRFARLFSWGVLRFTKVQVKVEGGENLDRARPCVFVANHQSGYDMATLGTIYPKRTVLIGKKELLAIPVFGLMFYSFGNILLDRGNRTKALKSMSKVAKAIRKRNVSVFIFPEGTRNPNGIPLYPFKKGAFFLAVEAGIPIVPIVSSRVNRVFDWPNRVWRPGTVTVRILEPVSVEGYDLNSLDRLAGEVRARMNAAATELAGISDAHAPGLNHPSSNHSPTASANPS